MPPLLQLHTIPVEDPAVYDMVSDADTVGVFQIESRAQMSMLPRLQPRRFYDLVIEVAIVRPGPIQGKMVHPYLQRRERMREDPSYEVPFPSEALREVLKETLGVPLFQEQAMRLAVVAAGFTATEADGLRRAMAAWKKHGGLEHLRDKFINGMLSRGYEPEFAEQCFQQISGFGKYGFPESHAASFAKLVYASAWLKRHHPAAFAAALLNSQPMGFYGPAQLVRDAREHGVTVRAIDVNESEWDCTLEYDDDESPGGKVGGAKAAGGSAGGGKHTWGVGGPALRLGFRQVKGMRQADADRIVRVRRAGGRFTSVEELQRAAELDTGAIDRLARADAFASIGLSRRSASWQALALTQRAAPLVEEADATPVPALPVMPEVLEVFTDYGTTGLSLKRHPVAFARAELAKHRVITNIELLSLRAGVRVSVAGLVLVRQRPSTASGVVFITLEDETATANLILWSPVYEKYRNVARHATLLQTDGILQREGKVIHVLAHRLFDRTELIPNLRQPSRDFH